MAHAAEAERRAKIRPATTPADLVRFAALVREYVESLPFPLDFQDVDQELACLGHEYGPPGGCVLLADLEGEAVGCVAIRPLEPPAIAELKRMYLQPRARGWGIGRALAAAALERAGQLGYERVRLDTVAEMVEAAAVYTALGFYEIEPYTYNPLPTARFYETRLPAPGPA